MSSEKPTSTSNESSPPSVEELVEYERMAKSLYTIADWISSAELLGVFFRAGAPAVFTLFEITAAKFFCPRAQVYERAFKTGKHPEDQPGWYSWTSKADPVAKALDRWPLFSTTVDRALGIPPDPTVKHEPRPKPTLLQKIMYEEDNVYCSYRNQVAGMCFTGTTIGLASVFQFIWTVTPKDTEQPPAATTTTTKKRGFVDKLKACTRFFGKLVNHRYTRHGVFVALVASQSIQFWGHMKTADRLTKCAVELQSLIKDRNMTTITMNERFDKAMINVVETNRQSPYIQPIKYRIGEIIYGDSAERPYKRGQRLLSCFLCMQYPAIWIPSPQK